MISYSAIYTRGARPYLAKIVTTDSGESYETKLSPNMDKDELSPIPLRTIYSHLDNIVLEMQDASKNLSPVYLDDEDADLRYALSGYREIELLYLDSVGWFEYIYKNREPEELQEETPA